MTDCNIENIQIKPIGGRYLILILPNQGTRDDVIKEKWLEYWFDELKPWSGESANIERFAWLNCYGMPLNAWNLTTFREIGNHWGQFIEVDSNTLNEVSYEVGRVLIATDASSRIEDHLQIVIQGMNYMVRVEEMETFRVVNPITTPSSGAEFNGRDDDMADNKSDKDGRLAKNHAMDVRTTQLANKGDNFVIVEDPNQQGEAARAGNIDGVKEAINVSEKEEHADQHSCAPKQDVHLALEVAENNKGDYSNFSQDLDSFVVDSESPIMTIGQDDFNSQKTVVPTIERVKKVKPRKDIRESILCLNGPIVIGSDNDIRVSQLPSINLQVDLNPKEARKALRKKARDECTNSESCEYISNSINAAIQGQVYNQTLRELEATAEVGRIIGVKFSNTDLLDIEKMIEKDSNRFALLQRSNFNG